MFLCNELEFFIRWYAKEKVELQIKFVTQSNLEDFFLSSSDVVIRFTCVNKIKENRAIIQVELQSFCFFFFLND